MPAATTGMSSQFYPSICYVEKMAGKDKLMTVDLDLVPPVRLALNGLFCADVPLRTYPLCLSRAFGHIGQQLDAIFNGQLQHIQPPPT